MQKKHDASFYSNLLLGMRKSLMDYLTNIFREQFYRP